VSGAVLIWRSPAFLQLPRDAGVERSVFIGLADSGSSVLPSTRRWIAGSADLDGTLG
jgi:hypothetical protein